MLRQDVTFHHIFSPKGLFTERTRHLCFFVVACQQTLILVVRNQDGFVSHGIWWNANVRTYRMGLAPPTTSLLFLENFKVLSATTYNIRRYLFNFLFCSVVRGTLPFNTLCTTSPKALSCKSEMVCSNTFRCFNPAFKKCSKKER